GACTRSLVSVVIGNVVRDCIVRNTEGESCSGNDGRCRWVRCKGDSAVVLVVMDVVFADEIVVAWTGLIRGKNAPRVVADIVSDDGGVIYAHQVNAFSAIVALIGFECGNATAGMCT